MSTVHLEPIGMIQEFQFGRAISGGKTKCRLECRDSNLGWETKKGNQLYIT